MYVKDYMSTNLITIEPTTSLLQCQDLLKQHRINRLPVVQNNRLVGLVTHDLLIESLPSNASSLDRHEVNYLLDKATAKDIMLTQVPTVPPLCLLNEAAQQMTDKNIGALVVTEVNELVGIITDKDIFRAFVDISGAQTPGKSLVLEVVEDRIGIVEEVGEALRSCQINLTHMMVYHLNDLIRVVLHVDATDVAALVEALEARHFTVHSVI